ncbi:MAG: FTR1 family iron permease [Bifidobacteriaceae bacterium]|jgi:high-affinity iron transporter|nr:FTR1 family iron permease [Bifidobacteriaceae bacterium]
MIRKTLAFLALSCGLVLAGCAAAPTADTPQTCDPNPETWSDVASQMVEFTDDAYNIYVQGQAEAAKNRVDNAYYGCYEERGFEKIVMAHLSGDRATAVEYQFAQIKKTMLAGGSEEDVRAQIDELQRMVEEDAARLDGSRSNPFKTFLDALVIILREGLEAILVVGAIIAYLIKSDNANKLKVVWAGVWLALAASVALAFAVNAITELAGANQEIIEGVTVLIAVAMLIWVSNWIFAKSDAAAWSRYVADKTQKSLSSGSTLSLALVAFLAVFREGAEVILFFQALRAQSEDTIWLGLAVGLVLLVAVYFAIRYLAIKIPLRPFFLATSVLLALLAFTFAGSGIKELQEGNAMTVTAIPGIPSVDLLGFYPTVETISAQVVVVALILTLFMVASRRAKRRAAEAPPPGAPTGPSTASSTGPSTASSTASSTEKPPRQAQTQPEEQAQPLQPINTVSEKTS